MAIRDQLLSPVRIEKLKAAIRRAAERRKLDNAVERERASLEQRLRQAESDQETIGNNLARASSQDDQGERACPEPVPSRQQKEQAQYGWKRYTYHPTGQLSLDVVNGCYGVRSKWSDGKIQRLENMLAKVVVGLQEQLEQTRILRLDRACEQRQRKRAADQQHAKQQRAKDDEQRRQDLHDCARDWEDAARITGYLEALANRIEEVGARDPAAYEQWATWAQWYAASLCPLSPTPPKPDVYGDKPPENQPLAELDLTSEVGRLLNLAQVIDTNELSGLTRSELNERIGKDAWSVYLEVTRVLAGLGYDVSERTTSSWQY